MKRLWIFQAASFLSAFLLFQVQPLTGKALLPGFGGSYLVWGASMIFYQAVLLAGYAYAHGIQRRLGVRAYARFHWIPLLAALGFARAGFDLFGRTGPDLPLVFSVLWLLACSVGVPVFVLSTTSLILQRWLSLSPLEERSNPYLLYAASNAGSLLGLLSYPLMVEPLMDFKAQLWAWWGGYAILVCLHVYCFPRGTWADAAAEPGEETATRPSAGQRASWFLLGMAASAMLLAVTNVLTLDVASVPFLWVLPLSVYLLSFVVTFKRNPWFPRWARDFLAWAILVGFLLDLMAHIRLSVPLLPALALHLLVLFAVCWNCHGELYRSRPGGAKHLTSFYLVLAAGGLAGSVWVGWVMPKISTSLAEYTLGLLLALLALAFRERFRPDPRGEESGTSRVRSWQTVFYAGVALLALIVLPFLLAERLTTIQGGNSLLLLAMALPLALAFRGTAGNLKAFLAVVTAAVVGLAWTEDLTSGETGVKRIRNYYGIYRIYDKDGIRYLKHGTTQHGNQRLTGPDRDVPRSYFHPTTPAAGVLCSTNMSFEKIGMIGLGTGALAVYTRPGQSFAILELDPDNLRIAEEEFSYLRAARQKGATPIVFKVGDGRLSIRGMAPGALDLLILDAFNSGSIPIHLLTVEALGDYFRVLGDRGLLLIHVSNRILDLPPVIYSNAAGLGLAACEKTNAGHVHPDADTSHWMALSRDPGQIRILTDSLGWRAREMKSLPRPWTDRYSNLLTALLPPK